MWEKKKGRGPMIVTDARGVAQALKRLIDY